MEAFISTFLWYGVIPAIARQVGRWRYEYVKQGITLAFPDTLLRQRPLATG